jgi:hypothetical protein
VKVVKGESALQPPQHYPYPEEATNPEAWYSEIVDWWQQPEPNAPEPFFNHGERIYRLGGETDQVREVAAALTTDPTTTRGVIAVVDPRSDAIGDTKHRMPAFSLIHVYFDADGQRVNCAGFFRKQQLLAWWPVNVTEMARVQKRVLEQIREKYTDATAGEIVTYASVTVLGTARPRVRVPLLDRDAADHPEHLLALVFALFAPKPGTDSEAEFRRYFDDWFPVSEEMEFDGVPVALPGLDLLARTVRAAADQYDSETGRRLATQLDQLFLANEDYSEEEDNPRELSRRTLTFRNWRARVLHQFDEALATVRELAGSAL